jgi:hypothetical protein
MRSYLSVAMPATWPSSQLFGNGFGQNGSTWNCGTSSARSCAADAIDNAAARTIVSDLMATPDIRARP